jgi:CSLREA domain-containing protein
VFAALFAAGGAHAVTFNVNDTNDIVDANPGDGICATAAGPTHCTLRAAIQEANQTSGAIVSVPAGPYYLGIPPTGNDGDDSGDLNITSSMTITGAGSATTTIDAAGIAGRVMTIGFVAVNLSGLTLQNGKGGGQGGGGILSLGALTLTDVVVKDCTGDFGGGISVLISGTLSMTRSRVESCHTSATAMYATYGGGIYLADSANATLTLSSVTGCSAPTTSQYASGGGIAIHGSSASLSLSQSTIATNSAYWAGGGIYNEGTLTVDRSFIGGNTATNGGGGGVDNGGASATITSSTIAKNSASYAGGVRGNYSLYSVTVVENTDSVEAGGLGVGTMTVQNLVAEHNKTGVGTESNCHATLNSLGFALVGGSDTVDCQVTGTVTFQTDIAYPDPADNGGPTKTVMLPPGSLAIDAGNPGGCRDSNGILIPTDQRGVTRQLGAHCDLGALEVEPIGDANGDGSVNLSDVFYLINYLFAGGPAPPGRANVNGDGAINVSDVFYLVNYLFASGPPPA